MNFFFKTAWRNIQKNKLTGFINIFGLAIGISCSLLIGLWVKDEMSYNRFIPGYKDVYQVMVNVPFNGDTITQTAACGPLEPALRKDIPEMAAVTKMRYSPDLLFSVNNKSLKENGKYVTDDFFKVFPLKSLDGNPDKAVRNIDQIVITRDISEKYFNTVFSTGKQIKIDNAKTYTVGAVIENLPKNSTLQFSWVINFKESEQDWMKTWGNISFPTFARLVSHASLDNTLQKMRSVYVKNAAEGFKNNYPFLQPVSTVYLYGKYENGHLAGGRIEYVKIFSLIAVFILLLACVNFMNLSTARASLRAKEIGMRKITGASRFSLIRQFMGESLFTCCIAAVMAVLLTWLLLPSFNRVFDKNIALSFADKPLWAMTLGLCIMTAVIAGSYPSLLLSSFKPVNILKGNTVITKNAGNMVRKILVTLQFAVSAFLIVCIIIIARQIHFIQSTNLGFEKEHLIYVPVEGELYSKLQTYQDELERISGVIAASPVNSLPMNLQSTSSDLSWPGKPEGMQFNVTATWVGYDFAKTIGATLAAGRDFSKAHRADSAGYVINEAAAKLMSMDDPVGKNVTFWAGNGPVVGVLKDFHIASMHAPITPLILSLMPENAGYMLIRVQPGNIKNIISEIGQTTRSFNPAYPFEYHFADEEYEAMYKSEMQVDALTKYFGILAICISCLGLFGLAAYTAERRTKEIGIRKVLGASVAGVAQMLSKEFLYLVLISTLIAFPAAWWSMHEWLNGFAYKADVQWWIFAVAGCTVLLIALVTVIFQAMKAAMANPVKALRTE
jgi:predicted permease